MRTLRLNLLLATLVLAGGLLYAADDKTGPTDSPAAEVSAEIEELWDHLEREEPYASHAVLKLATTPDQTVFLLKQRLKPLTIEPDKVRELIVDLGSDDEEVWKPAFETLEYFDPRLAIDLETLMNEVQESPARQRLVEVLSGRDAESLQGQNITLRPVGGGFNFSAQGSWWAEHQVSRLTSKGWGNPKTKWTRAIRAIVLLDHIGTPEALAIVEAMAEGHPEAEPTLVAEGVLDARRREAR